LSTSDASGADLIGRPVVVSIDQIEIELTFRNAGAVIGRAALGGSYNVENLLSATAGILALTDLSIAEVADVWPSVRPVPGRFEAVQNEEGIGIIVDYAHTPDALEKVLDAVRPLVSGKVIAVFGCGGDRDRSKRPKMAKAASERSDLSVVTSDNPRTEDPEAIVQEVQSGIVEGKPSVAIVDRAEAITYAISVAESGDAVVIAGKGHENYQIIGRTKHPMDDRELARDGLGRRVKS
jgi:UDP-N-acetylmuramoyl-L-alanyl-D-glutamate--2,6-diaminopimelate ligase